MNVLGLIPARGGSKGIPRKNLVLLGGKPLLVWTCEAALRSKMLSRVVLSTDDEEIAAVGRANGVDVPFLRPAHLARDQTPSVDVALHALDWLQCYEGWSAEVLVLLQPTSPFRRPEHIDAAVALLQERAADTVVSVVEVPHRFHPWSVMMEVQGWLVPFESPPPGVDSFRRQELPRLWARNGPAVLACRERLLRERTSFYGDRVAALEMSVWDSIDIDGPEDLELARLRLQSSERG